MRIKEGGSGSFGFSGGSGKRSDSFRQGRKPGQKVRGTLMKWVSDDMAWVNIDGQKLLAQLQSSPPVGAQLTFIIKQLSPNIILKEIFEVSGAAASAISIASNFETARTLFENQFRQYAQSIEETPPQSRLLIFIGLMAEHPKLFAAFTDTTHCLNVINNQLGQAAKGILHYSPWLTPSARRNVGFTRRTITTTDGKSMTESIEECELATLGMIRTEFLCTENETNYRLKIQNVGGIAELKHYIGTRKHPWAAGTMQCMGIAKLPPSSHGGLVAEFMFRQ